MGRRNKTHLCGPQDASVFVSKMGATVGLCSLLLLYYCFRQDGFLRLRHSPQPLPHTLTQTKKTQNKFFDITQTLSEIRSITIVPIGISNSKNSGFYEMSRMGLDRAVNHYEEMPNATKSHSVFLFHSYDMMSEGPDVAVDMHTVDMHTEQVRVFQAASHLTSTSSVNEMQVYDHIQSTQNIDLLSASLKVRQFIEAIVHVRLSLQASEETNTKRPYNNKLRSKLIGSKLQLNFYVPDVHVALYQSVMTWVLGLSPAVTDNVVYSVEVSQ